MITAFDQAMLTGRFVGLMHKDIRENFQTPNGVEWLDNHDGDHQPIIVINLPSNRFVLPVLHAAATEEETAALLAQAMRPTGNGRLQHILNLVAAGLDDAEIAKVLAP